MTLEELKEWLKSEGFTTDNNYLASRENRCKWYAWRRTVLPARECETNGNKAQIIVYPWSMGIDVPGLKVPADGVEVELCGEANGIWWKLTAYSLSPKELTKRLSSIERSLVAAWNALE